RPVVERAGVMAFIYDDTRGLDFARAEKSIDEELIALARTKLTGDWLRIGLKVDKDSPHGITEIRFERIPTPAEERPRGKPSEGAILEDLESYLDKLVAADKFSGSVLVARQGRPLFAKAYGLASQGYRVPNQVDTKFNLGSMNKMFTAVCITQL